ncbi:SDR family NAD(P)-dependent oxidoreductase [Evansella halocellulosilytica]|uniref:SDR family NAD(P)-dependent oxidoreductase n=1 Tax=Evansella halocellulosilytica TaxID=2011013 RepID=UPI000BB752BD|nr:glucose 1-dehydrogenase [Evansella halocellulosilytica]
MSFENKTFIITGAGGGMGKEIVSQLLTDGAQVVGCDVNVSSLSSLEPNENLLTIEGNFLEESVVRDAFKKTVDTFGQIDGLVNAAGLAQSATPVEEIDVNQFHKIMDVNMTMVFLTCREAVKYMRPNKAGSIVNIGSVSTTRPRPGLQVYVASKGAVESFTKALALELAPDFIRVNTLHPGPADTNMLGQFAKEGSNVDEMKETTFRQSVPLGSLIKPIDIAHSVKYLLSSEARMVTGAVLHVDGGRSV